MSTLIRRLGIVVALVLAAGPAVLGVRGQDKGEFKTQSYSGKVQALAPLLEKQGAKLDADAAEHWLALVAEDGKVYPLVKDDASRMFFKDKTLLNRPMRLTGRVVGATSLLGNLFLQIARFFLNLVFVLFVTLRFLHILFANVSGRSGIIHGHE